MSDGDILICVGKLVRRATTLLLKCSPDSDYKVMPDGRKACQTGRTHQRAEFTLKNHAGRHGFVPSGMTVDLTEILSVCDDFYHSS